MLSIYGRKEEEKLECMLPDDIWFFMFVDGETVGQNLLHWPKARGSWEPQGENRSESSGIKFSQAHDIGSIVRLPLIDHTSPRLKKRVDPIHQANPPALLEIHKRTTIHQQLRPSNIPAQLLTSQKHRRPGQITRNPRPAQWDPPLHIFPLGLILQILIIQLRLDGAR